MISGYEFEEIDNTAINQGPSAKHWFGTDNLEEICLPVYGRQGGFLLS